MQDYFMLATNSESLGDDSFDMMIATQDELHGSTSGFDSMMQTVDDKATT